MQQSSVIAACLLIALPVLAGDGAIPIYGPILIQEPGHYVLTRDIRNPTSIPILVYYADDVHIDLNGFTIEYTDPCAVNVRNSERLTLRNGHFKSCGVCVYGSPQAVVEDLRLSGGKILIDSGIDPPYPYAEQTVLRRNVVRNSASEGIFCRDCAGGEIADNAVFGATEDGIVVYSDGCRIVGNVVRECETDGIEIHGTRNHVEGNLVTLNGGIGLYFISSSVGNLYRGNTARGNGTDLQDDGTGNTSHGDNYLPGQM